MINNFSKLKLAVIGLGYVGLPLALEFAKKKFVIGFDISKERINQLKSGKDRNLETTKKELQKNKHFLQFTCNKKDLKTANCYIITVPTPLDKFKKPDLKPLFNATKTIAKVLKKNDLVIYESTVFPGCTEEKCVPILEKFSNLKYNKDFFCGYSPERINPGDKKHTISSIKKVTSGSTSKIANLVDSLYSKIIKVGTYKASSIKVAEAAKIIENTQRDLNIALINELSILFNKMNIDMKSVLKAAESKWNFLPFTPGLVGGHCIGVDPYYLTHKAKEIGYQPKIILAGRKLNDGMSDYVTSKFLQAIKKKKINIAKSRILIMGLTFKENCADTRNSGVKIIIEKLKKYNCKLDLFDPWVKPTEIVQNYKISAIKKIKKNNYDGILIVVNHNCFKKLGIKKIKSYCKKEHVIFDLKNLFSSDQVDFTL